MLFEIKKSILSNNYLYFMIYTERLLVRVNDKDESKFSIILFQNGESRGFIILIHIMTWKFDIVITVFNT